MQDGVFPVTAILNLHNLHKTQVHWPADYLCKNETVF